MTISIIFSVLFLILFAISLYFIISKEFLRVKSIVLICLYIMVTLQTLYFYIPNDSITSVFYKIISLTSFVIVWAVLICFFIKIFSMKHENFTNNILISSPIFIIEFMQLIFYITDRSINLDLKDPINIITLFSIIFAVTSLVFNIRNIHRDNEYKKIVHTNLGTDIPREVFYRYSVKHSKEYNKLSEITFKLYNSLKSRSLSVEKLKEYLDFETDLPESLKNRVLDRYADSYNLSRIEQIGLIEFANLIFPEFYSPSEIGSSSQKYESRLFEEYYFLLRKNLRLNTQQYEKINEKLEQLIILDNTSKLISNKEQNNVSESDATQYAQSIVREINHCVKTPLLAVKYAIQNLLKNTDNLTDVQMEKIETASGNIAIIQSILNGYRKLVIFADDSNPEKITEHILTAVSALNQQSGKNIKLDISLFVEPKNAYGNNIVTIMLLTLVNNAYEASPVDNTIKVSCQDKHTHFLIRVENLCINKVKKDDLIRDGFTTKEKGGEGLRSIRRISESLHFDFSINVYESGYKVVATLKIPKNQEDIIDDK